MRLVSLDTSTKVSGCALFVDGNLVEHRAIDYSKTFDSEERMNKMCVSLVGLIKEWAPEIIVAEHPQGAGANILVVNRLSEIIGAIRLYAAMKSVQFTELMPTEWRKLVGMKQGRKTRAELKQTSRDMALDMFGEYMRDDESDACLIGQAYINKYGNDGEPRQMELSFK